MTDSGPASPPSPASATVKIRRPVGKAGRRPPTILRAADRARRSGDASDDSDDWVAVERPSDRVEEAGGFDEVEEAEEAEKEAENAAAGDIGETEEPLADPSPEQQDEDEKEKKAAKPRMPRGAVPLPGALLLPGGGLPMPLNRRLRPSRVSEEKEEEKEEKEKKEKEKEKKEKEKEKKEKEKEKKEDSAPAEGRSKVPPPRPALPPQRARVLPAGPMAAPRLRRTNPDETPAKSPPPPPRPPKPQKLMVAKDNEKRTGSASKSGKQSKE